MKKCPKCGNDKNIIAIEYRGSGYDYDGISEWYCLKCEYRQGRWTEEELADDELEAPLGRGKIKVEGTNQKPKIPKYKS